MPDTRVDLDGRRDPLASAKDNAEARLAREVAAALQDQYADLLDHLSETDTVEPAPEFWERWQTALSALLLPFLMASALDGATAAMQRGTALPVPLDALQTVAEEWASAYTFRLVSDINDNSRDALRRQLQNYYSGALDYDALLVSLQSSYSPVRAAMIAATETQRGYEQGINAYEDELRRNGVSVDRVWYTVDRDACPICLPNHGQLRERDGWSVNGIPAHPNCRCFSEIVFVGEG